jgi:hypothetical protein
LTSLPLLALMMSPTLAADPVKRYAAGSLRDALTDVGTSP